MPVPARVSLVTLAVSDVAAAVAFYARLGWETSAASVPGTVAFLRTAGARLALYGAADQATDLNRATAPGGNRPAGVVLALNVASPAEVDSAVREWAEAGGSVLAGPVATPWGGYSGHVIDPDGHVWEVAHNPGFPLDDAGLPTLP